MEVNLDDFRRHFELLSDETLLATNRDELIQAARSVYDEEIERRGLNGPPGDSTESNTDVEAAAEQSGDPTDALVVVATYNIAEEASLARGLMDSAGIPCQIDNEFAALGGIELRLWVPKSMEADAIEILEMEISEEDLAAQAEAAGMSEMDELESGEDADTQEESRTETR